MINMRLILFSLLIPRLFSFVQPTRLQRFRTPVRAYEKYTKSNTNSQIQSSASKNKNVGNIKDLDAIPNISDLFSDENQLKYSTSFGIGIIGFLIGNYFQSYNSNLEYLPQIATLSFAGLIYQYLSIVPSPSPAASELLTSFVGEPILSLQKIIAKETTSIIEKKTKEIQLKVYNVIEDVKNLPKNTKMKIIAFVEQKKLEIKTSIDEKVNEIKQVPSNTKLILIKLKDDAVLETENKINEVVADVKKTPNRVSNALKDYFDQLKLAAIQKFQTKIEEIKKIPGKITASANSKYLSLKKEVIELPGKVANTVSMAIDDKKKEFTTSLNNRIVSTKAYLNEIAKDPLKLLMKNKKN